jgi:hypothetical protein
MLEARKQTPSPASPLPLDYLKMVSDVFTRHFESALQTYCSILPGSSFEAQGAVSSEEIWLSLSLVTPGQLSANTLSVSVDFDPKASAPTASDLLEVCVDSLQTALTPVLETPEKVKLLAEDSAQVLEDFPPHWTPLKGAPRTVYLLWNRSNPLLDRATDQWLAQNDPEYAQKEAETQKQTQELFFTGPKDRAAATSK